MPSYTTVPTKGQGEPFTETMWDAMIQANVNGMLSPPLAAVRRTTTLALTQSVPQPVDMPTEDYDTDGMHETSGATSRLTCRTAGLYLVTGWVTFASYSGAVNQQAAIRQNSTTVLAENWCELTAGKQEVALGTLAVLTVGEWVEVFAMTGASSQSVEAAALQAVRIGRAG